MTSSFHCRCGYSYEGPGQPDFEHDPAFPDACCNCGGQKCTACVSREIHDRCVDDCPDCCPASVEDRGPREDVRVEVDAYIVRPTGYDELVHSDKDGWCLAVTNGHAWGWSVRRAMYSGGPAMNREGVWVYETRGSGRNKPRRYSLDEALRIALEYVDTHRINGRTAAEASAEVARRQRAV